MLKSHTVRIALIVSAVAVAAAYGVTLLIINSIGTVL